MQDYRHLCSELVSITCLMMSGPAQVISGNLEEIGRRSALVLSSAPIRCGERVQISCPMNRLKGVVRSCTFKEWLGFFVEVKLDPESHWSPRWFTPKHLLALARKAAT